MIETTNLTRVAIPRDSRLLSAAPYGVLALFLLTLPIFMPTAVQGVFTRILIFAIFALSLDLIFGYARLWSLGHAAFFGVAGYTVGLLALKAGIDNFWLALIAGVMAAALASAIFGFVALRTSGVYFLLITFALGQLVFSIALKWTGLTGGSDGLPGIPPPHLGFARIASSAAMYYLVLGFFFIVYLAFYLLIRSPFGLTIKGIGENELRMRFLGYNTWLCKYLGFVVAGLLAGVSGALFAHFNGLMAPTHVGVMASAMVMVMLIIGGSRTMLGPLIGAALIILLEYYVSIYTPERWPLLVGAAFVAAALYARGGIVTHLGKVWERLRQLYGSA